MGVVGPEYPRDECIFAYLILVSQNVVYGTLTVWASCTIWQCTWEESGYKYIIPEVLQ